MLVLLFTIAGIHLVALMTPGPDFFYVSQVAVSHSRKDSFKAILGIVMGVLVWAGVALLGLHILLQKMAWLQKGIMLVGGLYLSYLGYLLLKSAINHKPENLAADMHVSATPDTSNKSNHLFLKGLFTNLSNPKAVIYFGSVFSPFVGGSISSEARWCIFALIIVETFLWFTFVATVFALPPMRRGYKRLAKYIDGLAGILFAGFGLSLIYKSLKPDHVI